MIRLAATVWLLLVGMSYAAPVTVKSGEHEGFTRLVLDFGTPVDWAVGRTSDGYELRLQDMSPTFDLTQTFDIIGKSRLAAIWSDPVTATLHVGIACACHAIPFEFRPGIVVLDLRDGPPPRGSSFEQSLDGSDAPALAEKPKPRPRARPESASEAYVWTRHILAEMQTAPDTAPQIAPTIEPAMEPLRASLLRQLSRGAAQGVVNMALPKQPTQQTESTASPASVRFGLGEIPGLSIGTGLPDHADLGADGENCVSAQKLDFSSWGSDAPVSAQMSESMADLIGEFDKPDPVAVKRAAQFLLFLGFGAEVHQLLRAFPVDDSDVALWRSLADILDETSALAPAFRGQLACDTPAALWAVLSDPAPAKGDAVNRDAVVLAFSALPAQLRRHLGLRLANRFLALGDAETASAIRNAILRAPGMVGSEVTILNAEIEMTNGDPAAAEALLDEMLVDSGPGTPAALVALVAARVAQDLPIEPELVVALDALLAEQADGEAKAAIQNALVLAQAASGNFDAALAALPSVPDAAPDVWRLLAKIGSDDAVLAHAVLSPEQPTPFVPSETSAELGVRLLNLGLAQAAQRWIGPNVDNVLMAKAQLARQDGSAALLSLADVATPEALALRAEALRLLNDNTEPQAYADAGDLAGQLSALSRQRNWAQLASLEAEGWTSVIGTLDAVPADPTVGPLARGHQLANRSVETRAAVSELLTIVKSPRISPP